MSVRGLVVLGVGVCDKMDVKTLFLLSCKI
jgi:hypothetical protein